MAFFIGLSYNVLHNAKDSLLLTAPGSSAAAIPFAKVWAMFPMAILIASLFVKLSGRYSSEKVFYLMMSIFLTFFVLFAFVLYPLRDFIHPHQTANYLEQHLPEGLKGLTLIIRYWSFSLFYAMSELWGTTCLTVLFWGFANDVTKVGEAARFYGLLSLGANFSSVCAGQITFHMSKRAFNPSWIIGVDRWHQSLILLTLAICVSGLIAMALFRWLNVKVICKSLEPLRAAERAAAKMHSKPSIQASIAYLAKSKYLISIAVVVFAYNVCINLVEVLWKHQVHNLYSDPNLCNAYFGKVTTAVGVVSTLLALLATSNIIRRFGWTVTALITPIMFLATSVACFTCYLCPHNKLALLTALLGMSPLALAALAGSTQNAFLRGCKYTLFDASKELAFIPLSRESRIKGKAAIDGVGSRMGKSGGALIHQGFLVGFKTLEASAPYIAVVLIVVLAGWLIAIRSLGRQFSKLTAGLIDSKEPAPLLTPQAPLTAAPSGAVN